MCSPSCFGLLLFPSVHLGQTPVIIVAQTTEVIEGNHLEVWPGDCVWQFLADGVEGTESCLFFDALGQDFFRPLRTLLRRWLIARDLHVHWTFVVLANVEDCSCVPAIDKNGWF